VLAENIKRHRKKLKLTQEALARKANVSYNTVIKLESEGITDPRMETLKKLAAALNVSIDALVGAPRKNSK
jgi:transcriptional regulator with XRE-family HTH domain